jgi:peptidoglycan/xylan/chitin deacetylase (PgdA/CDA1 family)
MSTTKLLPYSVRRLDYDSRKGVKLWPNGARMAVLIYTCPEEWEWETQEPFTPLGTFGMPGEPKPSLSMRTAVQYGYEVGLKRLRDIAGEHGIRMTLGTTGNAAVHHGDLLRSLADAGHEIAAHGYSEGSFLTLQSREQQAETIDRTVKAIAQATGRTSRGWWSPGAAANLDTVELLGERKMLYHGDLQDDELPYIIDTAGHSLVQIPYNMVGAVNDFFVFVNQRRSVTENLAYLTSTFDAYYEQAASTPLFLTWGTHPYVSGRPDAARVFSKFIAHMKMHQDVWFATYSEVAEWWLERQSGGN